ncbi:MAG: heme-binding domain-containing protein [Myxococcota bacterium]
MTTPFRKAARIVAVTGIGALAVVQLVPYGRHHTNPPVKQEPAWNHPETRALAARACFDCHSNETHWPWYAHVAPFSWLVQRDVDVGRRVVNFSEWDRPHEEADESAETVLEGEMPPAAYVLLHPAARLTSEQKRSLANGLAATIGSQAGDSDGN